MTMWLAANDYQVGLTGVKADVDEQFHKAQAVLNSPLLSLTPVGQCASLFSSIIETDGTAEDAARVVEAVLPLADLVGRKQAHVLVFILAERLAPDLLGERLVALLNVGKGLKKLGIRTLGVGHGYVTPVLLYTSTDRLQAHMDALADVTSVNKEGVTLQAEFVDLSEGVVYQVGAPGLGAVGDAVRDLFGVDWIFSADDLDTVYSYMEASQIPG